MMLALWLRESFVRGVPLHGGRGDEKETKP
jgi:hypothetical protein